LLLINKKETMLEQISIFKQELAVGNHLSQTLIETFLTQSEGFCRMVRASTAILGILKQVIT
jgi:hypothetical protein